MSENFFECFLDIMTNVPGEDRVEALIELMNKT